MHSYIPESSCWKLGISRTAFEFFIFTLLGKGMPLVLLQLISGTGLQNKTDIEKKKEAPAFPWEDIPRHGKCNSHQCRSNGRPRERERNKMDYGASVALPRHTASIPRVPERLGRFVGRHVDQRERDGWN
ncbi:hypothetical protein EYF80_034297 [Liparis tanakae]|uniref:Uncharacterized protein n=1 Tax=Liparis tanakae TaxID=230148 RepID=A0A4Z2GQV1_9TELE|nr:hypothetical protein EYF80_034297 [Liparis tanakae]